MAPLVHAQRLARLRELSVFAFLLRRIAWAIATLWLLSLITFLLGALAPGGPAEVVLGQHANPRLIAEFNKARGLDQPLFVQYSRWLGGVVRGDLGVSFRDNQPIMRTLSARYPITVRLALMAGAFAVLLGVPLGLVAALRPGTWVDRVATSISLTGVSIPAFVMLPLLVLVFSLRLGWFPVTYNDQWWHLLLPAIALGTRPSALVARMTRASFLEALAQDYVRTARDKGLSWA
ncbi:MAG: ABC transporter permease, partial [Actinomycetota bacterium]